MAYDSLLQFVQRLESEEELRRVREEISPILEITEYTDRVCKAGGPALLFENVVGSDMPVLTNAFGSLKRMALALGVSDIQEIADEIGSLLKMRLQEGVLDRAKIFLNLFYLSTYGPKRIKSGSCKEVIHKKPDLDILPILKCWPKDGGRFITLPMVFSIDPETGQRNVGMYRMQVYDNRTTGMHWHVHKVGAAHYRKYQKLNRRMEIAVALGGDPAVTYAATAPLPEGADEIFFAGFLRKKGVEMMKCQTNGIEVPANSDIVLEGYIEPNELRMEGPFGDHTGYYSLEDEYPVFHIECITHKKDAIYPATIVGRPPMEDCFIAKTTERLFLPVMKIVLPEIVDINLPMEGVFNNLAIVSIKKQFPYHAQKVMHSLWGMGQMMLTKIIVIADGDVDVQNPKEVVWRVANNIDPKRDIIFVEGPVDVLNHASPQPNIGSKMGIDGTKKWRSEGFTRPWPETIEMTKEIKGKIDKIFKL